MHDTPAPSPETFGPAEFRAIRERLGLSAAGMGALLRVNGRTIRKWEAGDRAIPGLAAMALGLLLRLDQAALAAALAAVAPKRGRRRAAPPTPASD